MTPVIIILYNRPLHTKKLLNSITKTQNYKNYKFYIFCDGPKNNEDIIKIKKIKILTDIFKKKCSVKCSFRKKNIGLMQNMTKSINHILKNNSKAIILEDDLILNKYFFDFMNNALLKYKYNNKVFQISGYSYPVKSSNNLHYFLPLTSCWGWGITSKNWNDFYKFLNNKKLIINNYLKIKRSKSLIDSFNFNNSYDYLSMLQNSLNKKVNSWGIIFYLYLFVNNKITLFPYRSLVKNIGFDGSGNHKSKIDVFNTKFSNFKKYKFPEVSKDFSSTNTELVKFFKSNLSLYGKLKNRIYEKLF